MARASRCRDTLLWHVPSWLEPRGAGIPCYGKSHHGSSLEVQGYPVMSSSEQLELQRAHTKASAQLLHNRHLDEECRACTCVCEGESRAAAGNCQNP